MMSLGKGLTVSSLKEPVDWSVDGELFGTYAEQKRRERIHRSRSLVSGRESGMCGVPLDDETSYHLTKQLSPA